MLGAFTFHNWASAAPAAFCSTSCAATWLYLSRKRSQHSKQAGYDGRAVRRFPNLFTYLCYLTVEFNQHQERKGKGGVAITHV